MRKKTNIISNILLILIISLINTQNVYATTLGDTDSILENGVVYTIVSLFFLALLSFFKYFKTFLRKQETENKETKKELKEKTNQILDIQIELTKQQSDMNHSLRELVKNNTFAMENNNNNLNILIENIQSNNCRLEIIEKDVKEMKTDIKTFSN